MLREAVGSKADLLFGTHGQMTAAGAIRLARRLEPYDPLWFEEPVPPDSPEEMAKVARATTIPIATGERLATKYDFARLLRAGSAAILQMNLGRVGGLLEAKKIAGMAECEHVQIAPHLYCGPVVGAANVQLATCSPNFLILESIERWQGFHSDILKKPIRWQDGYVIPPTEPGLGVELNEEFALRHPYQGNLLHLDMDARPVSDDSSAAIALPRLMSAVLLKGHGGFEQLEYRDDVQVPAPGAGDVLVRIGAAGVNNTDINTRIGWYAQSAAQGSDASIAPDAGGRVPPCSFRASRVPMAAGRCSRSVPRSIRRAGVSGC